MFYKDYFILFIYNIYYLNNNNDKNRKHRFRGGRFEPLKQSGSQIGRKSFVPDITSTRSDRCFMRSRGAVAPLGWMELQIRRLNCLRHRPPTSSTGDIHMLSQCSTTLFFRITTSNDGKYVQDMYVEISKSIWLISNHINDYIRNKFWHTEINVMKACVVISCSVYAGF